MKRTCNGCRALERTEFYRCQLGKKISFVGSSPVEVPCPLEECPKPKTVEAFVEEFRKAMGSVGEFRILEGWTTEQINAYIEAESKMLKGAQMSVMLGFGLTHINETKSLLYKIARTVEPKCDMKLVVRNAILLAGTYDMAGEKSNRLVMYCPTITDDTYGFVAVLEGFHYHFKSDYPLSPDGYAMVSLPFCVTVLQDVGLGRREYISVLGG